MVLSGLDGSVEVSELCRREGINPTQYYGWKKQLLSSAAKVFADVRCRSHRRTSSVWPPRTRG